MYALRDYRTSFNGDFCQLLTFRNLGGGIAYIDQLCGSVPYAVSAVDNSFPDFPTYSWTVNVVTHEFGHNFGSRHTHDCVWNGNATAIDGCRAPSGCANPGIPSGGGTIMSYCHLTGAGVNFSRGFGPQPGNLIRNKVQAAGCLQACGNPGGNYPDYLPLNLQVNGSSFPTVSPGQSVTGTVRVRNQGNAAATVHSAGRFYYGESSSFSSAQQRGDLTDLQPMSPGQEHPETRTFTIPSNASPGTRYIFFKADADGGSNGEVYEGPGGGENNNVISIQINVNNVPSYPDYIPQNFGLSTTFVEVGQEITTSVVVRNIGSGAGQANSRGKVYYSHDGTLDGGDPVIGNDDVQPLAPNQQSPENEAVQIPGSAQAGTRYLFYQVDADNDLQESNEGNNQARVAITVQPRDADLLVQNPSISPGSGSPGTTINVSCQVRNVGDGYAGSSQLGYYWSTNSTYDGGDILLGTDNVPGLGAGGAMGETASFPVPSVSPGTYYLLFRADNQGVISESNEGNNLNSVPFVVGTSLNANFTASTTSACQGETIQFSDQSSGSPTTYTWSFSPGTVSYVDGTSPTAPNPRVQFLSPGSYTVSLTVSNGASSDTETRTNYLSITSGVTPTASIVANRNNVCEGESITFTANVSGGGSSPSYRWMVNGNVMGTQATYLSDALADGDRVQLSVTSSSACATPSTVTSNTIVVSVSNSCGPDWPVTSTGENHTIIVQSSTSILIGGTPIAPGDYLGVYYLDGTIERYAGKLRWTGESDAVTVYGDDTSTSQQDGYRPGETFRWRLWKASTGETFEATATYRSPNNVITHMGQYGANGLSSLASLQGSAEQSQILTLQPGWNMVSTYIEPDNSNMTNLFSPIHQSVALVKNGNGEIYFPSGGINAIGSWQITQGYLVKILGNAPQQLEVGGQKVNPTNTPINLVNGWNLIAYLQDHAQPIAQALSSISDRIVLVKNNAGDIYSPVFGINNIGSLQPGQGYQVKMSAPGVLRYGTSGMQRQAPIAWHAATLKATHYTHAFRAGANASFFLHESSSLEQGDEIGVFSSEGALVGSAVYEGHALAFPIWGAERDGAAGLKSGEAFQLRVWREGRELAGAMVEYLSPAVYEDDAVIEARLAGFQAPNSVQLFPNPARGQTTLSMVLSAHTEVAIELYTVTGQLIRRVGQSPYEAGRHEVALELAGLPEGLYQLRVMLDHEPHLLRLSITR